MSVLDSVQRNWNYRRAVWRSNADAEYTDSKNADDRNDAETSWRISVLFNSSNRRRISNLYVDTTNRSWIPHLSVNSENSWRIPHLSVNDISLRRRHLLPDGSENRRFSGGRPTSNQTDILFSNVCPFRSRPFDESELSVQIFGRRVVRLLPRSDPVRHLFRQNQLFVFRSSKVRFISFHFKIPLIKGINFVCVVRGT